MPTFHSADGERFWSAEVDGCDVRLAYGKLGGKPREQVVATACHEAAHAEMRRRARLKRREGYVEQFYSSPLHRALEEAVVAAPDDLAAHMAYADWLSEHGDPRGELIQVQLALEDAGRGPAERKRLQAREAELLAEHGPGWLGELAPLWHDAEANAVRFVRGWVAALTVGELTVETARLLNAARELRLLRRLVVLGAAEEVGGVDYDFDPAEELVEVMSDYPALSVLRGANHFGNVEVFHVGDLDGGRGFATFPDASCVPEVIATMPRLRELGVNGRDLFENDLFATDAARRLRVLRLERVRLHDTGARELVRSKLLKNLEVLSLWNARISDDGARALARSKDLKRLTRLDVSFNWIGEAGLAALRKAGVPLLAEYQMLPHEDRDHDDDLLDELEDELDEFDDDWE